MPARYLVANWKMNVPPEGIEAYASAIRERLQGDVQVVLSPAFVHLERLGVALTGSSIAMAAQNCSDQMAGAFTGEISAAMVRQTGASHVILGHSERRALYGETTAFISRKLAMAIDCGLVPILCVGEDERVRQAGGAAVFVAEQIKAAMVPALEKAAMIAVAYEPVWAIGTGRHASGLVVAQMVAEVREALERFWPGPLAANVSVLYGGSVTPENAGELVSASSVDGFLVGGASLDSGKFAALHGAMAGA